VGAVCGHELIAPHAAVRAILLRRLADNQQRSRLAKRLREPYEPESHLAQIAQLFTHANPKITIRTEWLNHAPFPSS
jgi:hypothetical protein